VFLGCEPYIFEGSAGDVGAGGTWETGSNWSFNRLPTAIDTAIVRANVNLSNIQQVGELTIDSPFVVSIDTLQTLSIKENLINNGTVGGQGYLVFDGDVPQQIIGNGLVVNSSAGSFTNIRLDNSAGLTLTDDADVLNVLDLDAGTITIEADNFLTFKSTENQTAVLAEVASGSDISGCVIVERFIPPTNRSYRYMTSPVSTTNCGRQTIQDNLQEGFQVTDYTNYPGVSEIEGFGTHITGSNAVANGFDATQTGNASM
ncbi:hypothetical protein G3567_13240, partial [Psychroflexus sp. YR1-1]|nr:hypothetical protein [Psychroflexus aurantiacus]